MLADILRIADAKIVRDREQQPHRVEIRIREIGGQELLVVRGAQKLAAQQRFAGADFADHLGEALATARRD